MAIINIGSCESRCLGCGKSASPSDPGHIKVYGYGPENGDPGCGEPWTAVQLDYVKYNPETEKFEPIIGFVFENLRGLPLVGIGIEEGMIYPNE